MATEPSQVVPSPLADDSKTPKEERALSSTGSADDDFPDDVEKSPIPANANPNIVDWDGPDDPDNPMNWTFANKWLHIGIVSLLTFLTPLASSMFAPGVPNVQNDFDNHNQSLATFVVSVFLLGFAFGPLVIAPLSELYGRAIVYNVCNFACLAFTVGCAVSNNMTQLIICRFFAGTFGVAPLSNGGGTITDLVPPAQRGAAMAIWAMGPLMGPVVGPIAGGFLTQAKGWRWIFYLLIILIGLSSVACLIFTRETNPVIILDRKARRLRQETGNNELRSKHDSGLKPKDVFWRAIVRPTKLLLLNPICFLMSLYMAFVYALLYLLFTTFTFVFEGRYHFSQGIVGLVYIGVGVGMIIGLAAFATGSDRVNQRLAEKHNNGVTKPEYRLPIQMYTSWTIPVGFFIYGWTAQYHEHWAAPIAGTLVFGIGNVIAFMCITTYMVDAFEQYAASAVAATTILRSLFGATFPLFGLQMYDSLGLGWGNSLLGFIALAMIPVPFFFFYYGERIRTNPKFQTKLS